MAGALDDFLKSRRPASTNPTQEVELPVLDVEGFIDSYTPAQQQETAPEPTVDREGKIPPSRYAGYAAGDVVRRGDRIDRLRKVLESSSEVMNTPVETPQITPPYGKWDSLIAAVGPALVGGVEGARTAGDAILGIEKERNDFSKRIAELAMKRKEKSKAVDKDRIFELAARSPLRRDDMEIDGRNEGFYTDPITGDLVRAEAPRGYKMALQKNDQKEDIVMSGNSPTLIRPQQAAGTPIPKLTPVQRQEANSLVKDFRKEAAGVEVLNASANDLIQLAKNPTEFDPGILKIKLARTAAPGVVTDQDAAAAWLQDIGAKVDQWATQISGGKFTGETKKEILQYAARAKDMARQEFGHRRNKFRSAGEYAYGSLPPQIQDDILSKFYLQNTDPEQTKEAIKRDLPIRMARPKGSKGKFRKFMEISPGKWELAE